MSIQLNKHVLDNLQLNPDSTIQNLEDKLNSLPPGYLNIFHSEASKEELKTIAANGCNETLECLSPIITIENWNYHKIVISDQEAADIIHIPVTSEGVPSTEAEKAIVRAWHLNNNVIEKDISSGEEHLRGNYVLFLWKNNKHSETPQEIRNAIYGLFHSGGTECRQFVKADWWSKTVINIQDNFFSLVKNDKTNLTLFNLAICELSIKWRFLSLYRILERGYVFSILDAINSNFMKSPKSTLEEAGKKLENEVNQFINLVDKHDLCSFFEDFVGSVEELALSSNKYAMMLKKYFNESNYIKIANVGASPKYRHGVILCYLIRCSIVHSGSESLVFDEFDDADSALTSLVIPLENALISYMGISAEDIQLP